MEERNPVVNLIDLSLQLITSPVASIPLLTLEKVRLAVEDRAWYRRASCTGKEYTFVDMRSVTPGACDLFNGP
jgi:hypothetical protein